MHMQLWNDVRQHVLAEGHSNYSATRKFGIHWSTVKKILASPAVAEMEKELIDADHGGGLYKKRIALPGRGKSGSTRTLLASNLGSRWFFVEGFEKKDKGNLEDKELKALREYAKELIALPDAAIRRLVTDTTLEELPHANPR